LIEVRTFTLQGRKRVIAGHLGVLAVLTSLGLLLNERVWLHGRMATLTLSQRGDVAEQLWFLGVIPHLVFSGHSILHTDLAYAGSGGVNLMANTSLVGPALLLSGLTWLSGPVLALNVGLLLAPVLSGWAMYALLTRFTSSFLIATFGAVSFGFCPALLSHLRLAHFQLTFALVLPLLGLLAVDLLRGHRSPKRTGLLAGLALVVQYAIGAEMLAIESLAAVALFVAAMLVDRKSCAAWLRLGLKAVPYTLAVAVPLLCVPVAYELFGPRHFSGPPWANTAEGGGLLDFIEPWHPHEILGWLTAVFGNLGPQGAPINFVGVGVAACLLALWIFLRRDRQIRMLLIAIGMLMVLNLGKALTLRQGAHHWALPWMPWRLFVHVPVLQQLTVSRLAFATDALIVVALCLGLCRLHDYLTTRRKYRREAVVSLLLAVVAVVLVPVVVGQSFPLTVSSAGTPPPWVVQFGKHAASSERVLFLPYPSTPPGLSSPLAWQATAKFSYSILGGYLAVPAEPGSKSAFLVKPGGEEGALLALGTDLTQPLPTNKTLQLVASAITHRHPTTIVVVPTNSGGQAIAAAMTALLGRPPGVHGRVLVWRGVTSATFHPGDAARVARCVGQASPLQLRSASLCVVRDASSKN
jgi:hypothetical protein